MGTSDDTATANRARILTAHARVLRDVAADIETVADGLQPPPPFAPWVSASLADFAATNNLTAGDVAMLSGIHYRGAKPETESDWWYIWESIKRTLRGR